MKATQVLTQDSIYLSTKIGQLTKYLTTTYQKLSTLRHKLKPQATWSCSYVWRSQSPLMSSRLPKIRLMEQITWLKWCNFKHLTLRPCVEPLVPFYVSFRQRNPKSHDFIAQLFNSSDVRVLILNSVLTKHYVCFVRASWCYLAVNW